MSRDRDRDRDAPSIVWFRDDLRVADHPALHAAVERGAPIVCVYVLDEESPRHPAARRRRALVAARLAHGPRRGARGARRAARAAPRSGRADPPPLVDETGAGAVFWNRRYGGPERAVDARLKQRAARRRAGSCAASPPTCSSSRGRSARARARRTRCSRRSGVRAARRPSRGIRCPRPTRSTRRMPRATTSTTGSWCPPAPTGRRDCARRGRPGRMPRMRGSRVPRRRARRLRERTRRTGAGGDVPPVPAPALGRDQPATRCGTRCASGRRAARARALPHRARLAGVLFARAVPRARPRDANWRAEFDAFPWPPLDPTALGAWQEGSTGVPLVDAGMRELWRTGTMHNRIRMVVGVVPHQEPAHRLAHRRAVVLGHPRRRRRCEQPVQLAVGRRLRRGCRTLLPGLQPRTAGEEVRPRRRVHPPLGARVGHGRVPEPIVDLAASRRAALAAYEHVKAARR